jgi:hypothetical protein
MAGPVAQQETGVDVGAIVRHLHRLVIRGPRDLDIACAMSAHGYDAIKWAEGQGVLAELVSCDLPVESSLTTAIEWYNEAVSTARRALVTQPQLLTKLGVAETDSERS